MLPTYLATYLPPFSVSSAAAPAGGTATRSEARSVFSAVPALDLAPLLSGVTPSRPTSSFAFAVYFARPPPVTRSLAFSLSVAVTSSFALPLSVVRLRLRRHPLPEFPTKLIVSPLSGNLYVNRPESVESHAYV